MARKVIGIARDAVGPRGSRRRRWAILLSLVVVMGAGLVFMQTVLAVKDAGLLQLDGDAQSDEETVPTDNPSVAPDDWDRVCYEAVQKPVTDGGLGLTPAQAEQKCFTAEDIADGDVSETTADGGAVAVSWVEEPNPASTIFTGGGSKDPQDISNWLWKDDQNNPPDKDNIEHAYAARYSVDPPTAECPAGSADTCEVLYFGLDRFDASGDANTGFWFFQKKVSLTNIKSQGGQLFDGLHTEGDILVISGFSNGGTTATIAVYKWDPFCLSDGKNEDKLDDTACKADNLRLVEELEDVAAQCATSGPLPSACGIVNPSTITMPWAFLNKSGTPQNAALNGEFFEAGINLSLLGLSEGCFQSVLAETRSSTSPTAVLKDFVLGQFATCAPTLTTDVEGLDPNAIVSPGAQLRDLARIQITGAGSPEDAEGTVDFFLCGPATTLLLADCSTGGTPAGADKPIVDISTPANTTDGLSGAVSDFVNTAGVPLASGFYCFRAEADLTNYQDPAAHTNTTTECFQVRDTSSITTAQRWLPNDLATVTLGSGQAPSGTVTFTLFPNATCTPPGIDFGPIAVASGTALSNNAQPIFVTSNISWRAVFTPTDPNGVVGSTSNCEVSNLTIDNAGIP